MWYIFGFIITEENELDINYDFRSSLQFFTAYFLLQYIFKEFGPDASRKPRPYSCKVIVQIVIFTHKN
jgi:hypothetical protein